MAPLIIFGHAVLHRFAGKRSGFFVCDQTLKSAADQFPNIINTTALYTLEERIAWQSVPDVEKNQMIQRIDAGIVVCKKIMGLKRDGGRPTC
ncbi:MAG: hypothetical protein CVV32_05885 [Methanomicrobiales archaeon HGW-Methanomicrobiales-3]|nr:MAG: hypothetical protein CVV32_05885 [Methanomicrobiales archaeon HGW-Methanomicrobiales-3]